MAENWIREHIDTAFTVLELVRGDHALLATIERICEAVRAAVRGGGKLLACGNGGSATDALHLTEELVGRYYADRPPLPAICLSVDGPALTCIANDYGFERIFSRQVEALGQKGDVLVVFSTSGNSANIIEALKAARGRGVLTVGLLGRDGGAALPLCDLSLVVPHHESARIQEIHTILLHLICEALDRDYR